MFSGYNNKLANVPTISGLSNVVADDIITNNLIVDGVDVGTQVSTNTADITALKVKTTDQSYSALTTKTTFGNNLRVNGDLQTSNITNGDTNNINVAASLGQISFTVGFDDVLTLQSTAIEITKNTNFNNVILQNVGGITVAGPISISDEEIGYLDGLTDNIQTQMNTTVKTTGVQSIAGIKTFTTLPESSVVPTTANQLTNKTYVDSVAGAAITVALTGDNAGGSYYIPYSKTTSATSNVLYIDNTTTPLTYIPSTSTLTVSSYNIRATSTPSTISGSGLNVTYKNNNENGLQQFIVSTALGTLTMIEMGEFSFTTYVISDFNSELRFRSAAAAKRSVTNTFYNLNDTTAVAGGASQGRIYSDATNTYIEGFLGNHNIIGTENSTVSSRQLFNFGSSSASIYSPNLTLSGTTYFNVGQGAGDSTNVIIGVGAPRTIVYNASSRNTMVGYNSGSSLGNVAASQNTFVGALAGEFSSNCSNNTFVGVGTGSRNNTGFDNTFIGGFSGYNTGGVSAGTGSKNVCVGFQSGTAMITTASNNTLIGTNAGAAINTGSNNTCVGYLSGDGITSALNNVFIGQQSGFRVGALGTGASNVCVGVLAGSSMITTANSNTLVGTSAATAMTTGSSNTIVGYNSGTGITSSANNVFIGQQSGFQTGALGTGNNNTCIGMFSGDSMITTANGNTTYGFNSGAAITTGSNNTIIGSSNATTLTTGSNNIVIGNGANVLTAAAANVIAIGTSTTTMFIQGGFNHNIGSNLTATITLTAPLAQFYSVTMASASQVITLPDPTTASVKGAYVVFKRKTNTTHAFTIGAGAATMIPVSSITAAATVSIGTGTFNCELICDGVNWNVIQQS